MLAVPLLEHHGRHLRGVLGQGRNIPAKCQDEDNDEKIWDWDGNSDVDDEAINDDYKDEDKEDNNYDRATCRRGGPGWQRLPPSWRWPSTGCAPGRCRSGTPAAAPPSPR